MSGSPVKRAARSIAPYRCSSLVPPPPVEYAEEIDEFEPVDVTAVHPTEASHYEVCAKAIDYCWPRVPADATVADAKGLTQT